MQGTTEQSQHWRVKAGASQMAQKCSNCSHSIVYSVTWLNQPALDRLFVSKTASWLVVGAQAGRNQSTHAGYNTLVLQSTAWRKTHWDMSKQTGNWLGKTIGIDTGEQMRNRCIIRWGCSSDKKWETVELVVLGTGSLGTSGGLVEYGRNSNMVTNHALCSVGVSLELRNRHSAKLVSMLF